MNKKRLALLGIAMIVCTYVGLAFAAEVRKGGANDLSFATPNQGAATTWQSGGGATVTYIDAGHIPFRNSNNYVDDLVDGGYDLDIKPANITGDGTDSITGFNIPLYVTADLSLLDAVTARADVRAYGATGDGTTDDTTAIQAAIDAGKGTVYFPPGIYAISATLNLRTATEYLGPRGGTVYSGVSTAQTGYGAALKWIGSDNDVMVNMEGTYHAVWDGIDLMGDSTDDTKAELDTALMTGIRLHSDNDPASQRNIIRNVRIWNVQYGIIVGGLPAASYSYQNDGWVIENFQLYLVNTGIYVNGGNSSQYSIIRNGLVGQFDAGINLYECAFMGIQNVAFVSLESPGAGEANIIVRLPQNQLTIERTQGEPQTGTTWPHIRFTSGSIYVPVTLIGNAFDGQLQIANSSSGQKVVSLGNLYNDNAVLSGNDINFTSIGDWFNTGIVIVDSGSNNIITELDAYYTGGTPTVIKERRKFNNIVKGISSWNSVDLQSNGLTNLVVDDTTPTVSQGDFFQTVNVNPTTITDFDDGVEGQKIFVLFNDSNTTIDFSGGPIRGNGGIDNTMSAGDHIQCRKVGSYWYCLLGKI